MNNLNSKLLTVKASFTAYKDGERVECSNECSDNYEYVENESFGTSPNERETIFIPDPLTKKCIEKVIPVISSNSTKK